MVSSEKASVRQRKKAEKVKSSDGEVVEKDAVDNTSAEGNAKSKKQ